MVYVFLAEGFEETEAILPLDILRRGGIDVKTVGVNSKIVTGAHGIKITADFEIGEISTDLLEAIVLPGGMPGTLNLENSAAVKSLINFAAKNNKYLCAICAAPSILGHLGLLKGKKAICYPGMEDHLEGTKVTDLPAVCDGMIITGKGPGAAADFGFEILKNLKDETVAAKIKKNMCF